MKTKSNESRRAGMAGMTAVWRPSARYRGAAAGRVVCPASLPINIGGGLSQRRAFRPEGALRLDRRRIQSQNQT